MLGKTEGKRGRGWQKIKWLDSITDSMDTNLSKVWEIVEDRGTWHTVVHGVAKGQTQLRERTTTTTIPPRDSKSPGIRYLVPLIHLCEQEACHISRMHVILKELNY